VDQRAGTQLLIDYFETRDETLRDTLTVRHLPLVKFVARKMSSSLPGNVELDDLVSDGTLGLIDAITKYDPHRGVAFSTYAVTRIRGAILDGLQRMDWAPKQVTSKVRAVRRLVEVLRAELGRDPSVEELAYRMGSTPEEVRGWLFDDVALRVKPLDAPAGSDDSSGGGGFPLELSQDADQEVAGEAAEIRRRMAGAIAGMSEKERAVLVLYYRDNMTLREIAGVLDMSVSSATQTHTRMVEGIRARLASYGAVA
jgi:RNA polymerase sigma factor for flagellar operon FliA